jgi:hypothetical protein
MRSSLNSKRWYVKAELEISPGRTEAAIRVTRNSKVPPAAFSPKWET